MKDSDGNSNTVKRTNGFNFQRTPKVSSTLVQLEGLKAEAVFSPHNDPQRDWLKTRANLTGSLVDQATNAQASQMAFLPALEAGQPVASTLRVNPTDYFR